MSSVAPTIDCRMLCASAVAYAIGGDSSLESCEPYYSAVGFKQQPATFVAGLDDINACLVGTNQDGVILAFRGTLPPDIHDIQSLIDWMNDFRAEPIAVPGIPGKVHEGFWGSVDSFWTPVLAEVKKQMSADGTTLPLYITGHSKGGGMSPLAAIRFKALEGITPTAVYTYAAPHPGDTAFAAAYNAEMADTRYEYADDIVPHLPPTAAFIDVLAALPLVGQYFKSMTTWDYAAVGTLKFIDWEGQIVGDSIELEAERFLKLGELIVELKFGQIASDHNHLCGGGYMSGVCPTGVCPETS